MSSCSRLACSVLTAALAYGLAAFAAAPAPKNPESKPDTKSASPAPAAARPRYTTETIKGKVVFLDEALQRLYGVTTEPDAQGTIVALETPDGSLLPLVPDTRGRAFAVDERLRGIDVALLVRRYQKVPMLQVIRTFRSRPGPNGKPQLTELDYWCDICAIPMYILKPCECCQGETRLREQAVEPGQAP